MRLVDRLRYLAIGISLSIEIIVGPVSSFGKLIALIPSIVIFNDGPTHAPIRQRQTHQA
jgi:hypothetical protein